MFIKNVLTYQYNYAEYIVTDGKYDLICICDLVPFPPESKGPEIGMKIADISTFTFGRMNTNKIEDDENKIYLIEKGSRSFDYYLQAKVVDKEKALVAIGELIIEIDDEFPKYLENGDFVGFEVDRLDCSLDEDSYLLGRSEMMDSEEGKSRESNDATSQSSLWTRLRRKKKNKQTKSHWTAVQY